MKKVRFQTSHSSSVLYNMNPEDCHSPLPFTSKKLDSNSVNLCYPLQTTRELNQEPEHLYDRSNSSPYTISSKYMTPKSHQDGPNYLPSNDLELSLLDSSFNSRPELRGQTNQHTQATNTLNIPVSNEVKLLSNITTPFVPTSTTILKPIENNFKQCDLPSMFSEGNMFSKDHGFFIRPENKDGNYYFKKQEFVHKGMVKVGDVLQSEDNMFVNAHIPGIRKSNNSTDFDNLCTCHHCNYKEKENHIYHYSCKPSVTKSDHSHTSIKTVKDCSTSHCKKCNTKRILRQCCGCIPDAKSTCQSKKDCNCRTVDACENQLTGHPPLKAVDKKTKAIEKYEKETKRDCNAIQKSTDIDKTDCGPTVADLFKIIQLQNEQLKVLQEKVDKFISSNPSNQIQIEEPPLQNYRTEQVAIETLNDNHHKISIGVMTSFEMVRTSTFVNKEISKQKNAQVQCIPAPLNIKDNSSKKKPVVQNFLEGITPINNHVLDSNNDGFDDPKPKEIDNMRNNTKDNNVEKTVNDFSLYNLQIDNAVTPQLSPEQTIYLDVRDYSDSDDDDANVGWTYYNKVMTHVNGMLHDSDMPSSASAMYRNAGRCVQMQTDKSIFSITKRVTFGDDPIKNPQPNFAPPATETSMKMNQLAAKYLTNVPSTQMMHQKVPKPYGYPMVDMSFATRNYMERHHLLHGLSPASNTPQMGIPRFLDITALKQQPKLL